MVATVLAAARQDAGLSQRSLAQLLGKAHSHVSLIETGQRRVEALELYRMAKAFGMPPAVLFEVIAKKLESMEAGGPS